MIIGLTAVDGFMDFSTFAAMLKATIPCARALARRGAILPFAQRTRCFLVRTETCAELAPAERSSRVLRVALRFVRVLLCVG